MVDNIHHCKKEVFTNSVLKLGTLQAVTQLSGNEFQSFIDLFTKYISPILDFGVDFVLLFTVKA